MSCTYDELDISLAFSDGHNDAWESKPPKEPAAGLLNTPKHQSYRRGHVAGTTARYYFNAGYKAGKEEEKESGS